MLISNAVFDSKLVGWKRKDSEVCASYVCCVYGCVYTSGTPYVTPVTPRWDGLSPSVGRYFDTIVVSRYRFLDDTGIAELTILFGVTIPLEYRDTDDDTCHELKRICSEMITVAPTQVHKEYQRTFSYASQCFTVSKFHLAVILSSSVATVDTVSHDPDVIVDLDRHLTMSMHVSSVCCAAYCFLCQLRQVVRSVSVDAAKTSSPYVQFISTSCWYCNLSSIRHFRHPAPALTGRTECCSTLGHWHPKV